MSVNVSRIVFFGAFGAFARITVASSEIAMRAGSLHDVGSALQIRRRRKLSEHAGECTPDADLTLKKVEELHIADPARDAVYRLETRERETQQRLPDL